nr:hypothetical protein [Moraxella osloensis]
MTSFFLADAHLPNARIRTTIYQQMYYQGRPCQTFIPPTGLAYH